MNANLIVTEAAIQLGLNSPTLETSPELMREIYREEMFLDEFGSFLGDEFRPFQAKVDDHLNHPQNLAAFIGRITAGIIKNHPAMVDFLGHAKDENLFADAHKYRSSIMRMAHHTMLLNLLVEHILDDWRFMKTVHEYFVKHRRKYMSESFISSALQIFSASHSLFETAKMLTVDNSIAQYLDFRERASKGEELTEKDRQEKSKGLRLNIAEATLADYHGNSKANAAVGAVLGESKVLRLWVDKERLDVKHGFVDGSWSPLYQTWNFAFITGNLKDLDLMMPKLLVPVLVEAAPEDYLYRRGVTLWVTASIVLMNKLTRRKRDHLGPFPRAGELWGRINLEYATGHSRAVPPPDTIRESILHTFNDYFREKQLSLEGLLGR